jgi:5-methylcytosine-specific restriction endonuclease McrA
MTYAGEADVLQQSVVVFSQNYLPIGSINIKRAIALLVAGRAEPLAMFSRFEWQVRSPRITLRVPECIRLLVGKTERHWKAPPVSRRAVFRRDGHACQYCGSVKKLTIDHIVPRSRGGPHTWENVITACEPCNLKKGDRLPHEAGMPLRSQPKAPAHPAVAFAEHFWRQHALAED